MSIARTVRDKQVKERSNINHRCPNQFTVESTGNDTHMATRARCVGGRSGVICDNEIDDDFSGARAGKSKRPRHASDGSSTRRRISFSYKLARVTVIVTLRVRCSLERLERKTKRALQPFSCKVCTATVTVR